MIFGLEKYRAVLTRTLPYGIERKVDMARELAADPNCCCSTSRLPE